MIVHFISSLWRAGRLTIIAMGVLLLGSTGAVAANCFVYSVNIQGVVESTLGGSQSFFVNQFAIVRDAGLRSNPLELILRSPKDLNASGRVGDIELMTNSFFARNAGVASAAFDLAAVSVTNVNQFQLDGGQSFILPPSNTFVGPNSVNGALGGLCFAPGLGNFCQSLGQSPILQTAFFIPRQGGGFFFFPDGQGRLIQGEVDIIGDGPDNPNVRGRYRAGFAGNLINILQC